MNIETGREFSFTNPQDDPHLYPKLPSGFYYDLNGRVVALPVNKKIDNKKYPIRKTSS